MIMCWKRAFSDSIISTLFMAFVYSRSCLRLTKLRQESQLSSMEASLTTNQQILQKRLALVFVGVLVKVQTTGHHGWNIYVYFFKIFFPRTFSQWYRDKNFLTALISWCEHAGSLVTHWDLKRQISHVCCFLMFELISRYPKHILQLPCSKQLPSTRYSSSKKVCIL